MKNILVEFTEAGAIIHKNPDIIALKMNAPNCVLNPDMSRVSGVSPTFWKLDVFKNIVKCSDEEIQTRLALHKDKQSTPSVNVINMNLLQDVRQEFNKKLHSYKIAIIISIIIALIGALK